MDRRRERSSRRNRLTSGRTNEDEQDNYYSALGGDISFSRVFGNDAPRTSERIWFQGLENIPLDDIQRTGKEHDLEAAQYHTYQPQPGNRESSKSEKKRVSIRLHNIYEILEDWDKREIQSSFQDLPRLEAQVLEASWRGQIDKLHDALKKAKDTKHSTHALVNCQDSKGRTPLMFSSAFGHSQIVQFLLQQGATVNVFDKANKITPLGCACACGSLSVIEILLAHKADINAGLGRCFTPLHWSIHSGVEECVKKLIQAGANQNSYNMEFGTPLHLAASLSNENCMKILLDNGANVELCKGPELWTALHIATNEGSVECVELLLKGGSKLEAKDSRQQTPLHISANNGDSETTDALLRYRASTSARDVDGRTPLHKAVSKGNAECMLSLLEHAAEIDAQDNYGYSPLHLAAINDSSFSASFLLQEGADVTMRTKTGQSALSLLVKKMPHVIRYIRESLDNAVTINNIDPTDPECELKLDFRAMIANPTNKPLTSSQRSKLTQQETRHPDDDMQRETEFLTCLIKTGYKSYLSHPLIESFIVLKWQRGFMVVLYTTYIYEVYVRSCPFRVPPHKRPNETDPDDNILRTCSQRTSDDNFSRPKGIRQRIMSDPISCKLTDNIWLKIIWFLLCFISIVIAVKELFQMIQQFRSYFKIIGHYLQWLLLITIFMAVWPVTMTEICLDYWHYPSAAAGIVIAWSLMLVRIGKFPGLGMYIQILAKVIKNFCLFISAYVCLIFAFAFAFMILFPEEKSFNSIHRSLLKTITMMVGELNYEELFFETVMKNGEEHKETKVPYPITAHLVFAGFVIFITIILMNLLVGLAVHDIQSLEKGAKLERLLRQTSSISGLESFLFSKGLHVLLPNAIGSFLRKRALLVPSSYKWTFYFRPNDPRDRRLPKELVREALCLANSRQQMGKRPSVMKTKQNHAVRSHSTVSSSPRLENQLENLEKRLKENNQKDLDLILAQLREIKILLRQIHNE